VDQIRAHMLIIHDANMVLQDEKLENPGKIKVASFKNK
jgi:hypothetical protein